MKIFKLIVFGCISFALAGCQWSGAGDELVAVSEQPLQDSQVPVPSRPETAVVDDAAAANECVLTGCGGESIDLLAGREWVVEDLDGGGIIDRSRITLEFDATSNRLSGRASCNRYTAGYTLSGERLSITGAAATRMACAPSLMNQEQKFFRILEGIDRFDIDPTGALVLSGSAGTMKAYPASPAPR